MAINCILKDCQNLVKGHEGNDNMLLFIAIQLYAPIIIMDLYTIFRLQSNKKYLKSHPHPFIRRNCLLKTLLSMVTNKSLIQMINDINTFSSFLFLKVFELSNNFNENYFREIDVSIIEKINLRVIPDTIGDFKRNQNTIISEVFILKSASTGGFLYLNTQTKSFVPILFKLESARELHSMLSRKFSMEIKIEKLEGDASYKELEKTILSTLKDEGREYEFLYEDSELYSKVLGALLFDG